MILRFFDVFFVLGVLYGVGNVFDFHYFTISTTNFYWTIVLAVYLNLFGTIFEMYNLQVASNQFLVLRSTILTASTTVLVYLLTPIFSPELPSKRIQILLFYLIVFMALFLWRMFYVTFLASNRFFQNAILICDKEQVKELILGLENIDPHYKIIGFVHADAAEDEARRISLCSKHKKRRVVCFRKRKFHIRNCDCLPKNGRNHC